ncbi:MAG: sensor domain-containing diguanylate cyclase [Candidatus Omnitrophica bacterium]|nr:sensor domain-containing diguanylate cyclase [Candidatus Omnitrophota bacterium]
MYPLKLRIIILGILALLAVLTTYLILAGFFVFESNPEYLCSIIPYIAVTAGIFIILLPVLSPPAAVFIILPITVVSIVLLSALTGRRLYNVYSGVLALIALGVWFFALRNTRKAEKKMVAAQKIKEASNLVRSDWEKTERLNNAFFGRLGRYRRLRETGEDFSARISLENIYKLAVDTAYDIIPGSDAALLFIVDEARQRLSLVASKKSSPMPKIKSKNGDIFDKWVFKERQTLSVEDINEDFRFDYKPLAGERDFKSLISVPIINQSRIIGILRLNSRQRGSYSFDDLRLLDFVSDLASGSINNARLYKDTEDLSTRDSLTGFYIHRHMKTLLYDEVDRACSDKSQLSVIMIDIDHFKDYNDKYGHSAGDKVLLGVAHIIEGVMKKHAGFITRYGGEEFLIILPGLELRKAAGLAEKIRQDVAGYKFVLRREETSVTISAGVCSYSDEMKDKDDLLKNADFLLYKAKKEGRNKICAA